MSSGVHDLDGLAHDIYHSTSRALKEELLLQSSFARVEVHPLGGRIDALWVTRDATALFVHLNIVKNNSRV